MLRKAGRPLIAVSPECNGRAMSDPVLPVHMRYVADLNIANSDGTHTEHARGSALRVGKVRRRQRSPLGHATFNDPSPFGQNMKETEPAGFQPAFALDYRDGRSCYEEYAHVHALAKHVATRGAICCAICNSLWHRTERAWLGMLAAKQ
jgi:hypothetical protein